MLFRSIRKEKSQWMLRITKYADRLIDDLDDVDFIERVKTQQRNWIGRSTGTEVTFKTNTEDDITVYTTRVDTLFGVTLENMSFPNAAETLWNCDNVAVADVSAKGDYFAMNSKNMTIDGLTLYGNYSFDGVENVVVKNSKLLSKDAFWNSKNVTVYDSFISGEYLGWNAENLTLVNCTIESLQGLCYIDKLVMKDCKLLNTTLAFEYSTDINVTVKGDIASVFNPSSGRIEADRIEELIIEKDRVDPTRTTIVCSDIVKTSDKAEN